METAEWIAGAQARCDAVTPGPWATVWDARIVTDWRGEADDLGELPSGGYVLGHYIADVGGEDDERSDNEDGDAEPHLDAAFIAHARTDLPRALAALRAVLDLCDADGSSPAGRGELTVGEVRMAILDGLNA